MKLAILAVSTLFLAGCAATSQWGEAKTGGAVYSYSHTANGETCDINITSAREVIGVDVSVASDCTITTTTNHSSSAQDVIGVIGGLVNRIPEAQK